MTRLLLPFLIAFLSLNFSGSVKAQPTLTAADLSMQVGDQYLMAEMGNPFAPAPPYSWIFIHSPVVGPNQFWDYSAFTPSYNFTLSGLNRTTAPFPNEFSAANLVVQKGAGYRYFHNTGSVMTNLGQATVSSSNSGKLKFDIPYDEMRFPVTATTAYTDTFSYKVQGYYNNVCTAIEIYTFETLGYGTLKTPLGTFNDAVLVKTIRELKPDTCGSLAGHSKTIEYKWFAAGYHQPLVCFYKLESQLSDIYLGYYLQANITGRREEKFTNSQIQVFPNPAKSEVTIQIHLKTPSEVKLLVTDALGKEVLHLKENVSASGNYSRKFDVSNLPKGVYLVRLKTADQVAVKKLLVQ